MRSLQGTAASQARSLQLGRICNAGCVKGCRGTMAVKFSKSVRKFHVPQKSLHAHRSLLVRVAYCHRAVGRHVTSTPVPSMQNLTVVHGFPFLYKLSTSKRKMLLSWYGARAA